MSLKLGLKLGLSEVEAVDGVPAPQNLSTSNITSSAITLGWDAVTGADHYEVYLDDVLINDNITDTEYRFTNLTQETTYELGVLAVDSSNNKSELSTVQETTTVPQSTLYASSEEGGITIRTRTDGYIVGQQIIFDSQAQLDYIEASLTTYKTGTTSNSYEIRIYDDSDKSLVATSPITVVANGWNTFDLSSIILPTGTYNFMVWHHYPFPSTDTNVVLRVGNNGYLDAQAIRQQNGSGAWSSLGHDLNFRLYVIE